jgi:putative transposase
MSLRAYSEINLHFTWHVKDNKPVICDEIEMQLHRFIRGKAAQTPGVVVHGIGGTDDHIHLVVSIPPTLQSSEWVGELKGASSHYINHEITSRQSLQWQVGYGVVSFGLKDLQWVLAYVRNQRQHHASNDTQDRLERIEPI